MGSTGDPSGEPSLAPCGPLTPSRKRGAGRKSGPGHAAVHPPGSVRFVPRAVPVTVPAGGVADGCGRPRGSGCAGLRCGVVSPAEAPADGGRRGAVPAATAGGRSRLARHHLWDGSRRPPGGGGAVWLHCARSSAARRLGCDPALRRLPTGQRERSCALSAWTSVPSRPPRPCG